MFPFCIPATPFRHALTLRPVFFCLYFTGCCFLRLSWEGRTQLIVATVPHCGTPARKTALCSLLRRPQSLSGRPSRCAGIIYSSYFIKKFMQDVFFHLLSSVCAADKWRFFTEKLFCLRFAFPAKWRFVTGKFENFSIFSVFLPFSGPVPPLRRAVCGSAVIFFVKKLTLQFGKRYGMVFVRKCTPGASPFRKIRDFSPPVPFLSGKNSF